MTRKHKVLSVILALVIALLALPLSSHAATKYPTRLYISGSSQYVVDRTVAGSAVTTPTVRVKLQRYYRGAWRNASGAIIAYRTKSDGIRRKYGSTISKYYSAGKYCSVVMDVRGEYEFYYAGSGYNKPTRRFAVRLDDICASLPSPDIQSTVDEGSSSATIAVTHDISWNATDYPELRASMRAGIEYIEPGEMGRSYYYEFVRPISKPGAYTYTWTADTNESTSLGTPNTSMGLWFEEDPYIVQEGS